MKSVTALLIVFGFAAGAAAQSVEVTPFASYRWGGVIEDELTADFGDLKIDHGGAYGLIVEIPLVRDFGGPAPAGFSFELTAARQEGELLIDPGLFGRSEVLSDIDVSYYQAGIAFLIPYRNFTPFAALSGGFTTLEPEEPELDDETRFSFSFGGGLKAWVSDNLGVRFELRGFSTLVGDDDDQFCDRFGCEDEYETMMQGEARLGLVITF